MISMRKLKAAVGELTCRVERLEEKKRGKQVRRLVDAVELNAGVYIYMDRQLVVLPWTGNVQGAMSAIWSNWEAELGPCPVRILEVGTATKDKAYGINSPWMIVNGRVVCEY